MFSHERLSGGAKKVCLWSALALVFVSASWVRLSAQQAPGRPPGGTPPPPSGAQPPNPPASGGQASTAAQDPGLRDGVPGAGGPLIGLTTSQLFLFSTARQTFNEVDSVAGTVPGESGVGLGPSFNMNSCAGCHAYPAAGGSSPQLNPQLSVAVLDGANNIVPAFITPNGPVRAVRFKNNPDGTPDGGVHDLFVTTGRFDAPPGCPLAQTDFAPQAAAGNLSFRIPTPTFEPA